MSALRMHIAGTSYLLGRDTEWSQGLLSDPEVRDAVLYFEALRLGQHAQEPYMFVGDDDGFRLYAHDHIGERSAAARDCHSDISRFVRRFHELPRGWHVYEHDRPDFAHDVDSDEAPEAMIRECFEFVCRRRNRLHAKSRFYWGPEHWGEEQTYQRPRWANQMLYPPTVTVTPMPPREWAHLTLEEAKEKALKIRTKVERKYAKLAKTETRTLSKAEKRHRKMRRYTDKTGRSKGSRPEPLGGEPNHLPRFFGSSDSIADAKAAYRRFCEDHEIARILFKYVDRDVYFPRGTVMWRRIAEVNVL